MINKKVFRAKWLVWSVIGSVSLLFFPCQTLAETKNGALLGYIYAEDMVSPVAGAVVKLRNVTNGRELQSGPTDKNGMYALKTVSAGRYEIGVSSKTGDFNFDYQLQLRAGETAKLALALNRGVLPPGGAKDEKQVEKRIGYVVGFSPQTGEAEVYIEQNLLQTGDRIHVKGMITDFYQDVKSLKFKGEAVKEVRAGNKCILVFEKPGAIMDIVYLVSARKAFFATPLGIATIVGAAGLLVYGGIKIFGGKDEKSPSRK